jgi:hypothetical protein
MALQCKCPAARAHFSNEDAARAAMEHHLRSCSSESSESQYRACAVEADAA